MKKLFLILIAALVLVMTGCSTGTVLSFHTPWVAADTSYEYSAYEMLIVDGSKEEGEANFEDTLLARGVYKTEITKDSANNFTIRSKFRVEELKTGLVDTMESGAVIKSNLLPVSSYKQINLTPRQDEATNDSYRLEIDYADDGTYMRYWGYDMATGALSTQPSYENKLKTRKTSNAYDNEAMLYNVRGINGLAAGYSVSYKQFVGYDYYLAKLSPYTLSVSVNSQLEKINLGQELFTKLNLAVDNTGDYGVDAFVASVNISATNSGPAKTYYFCNKAVKTDASQAASSLIYKVPLRMEDMEYNAVNQELTRKFIYNLTDYSLSASAGLFDQE